MSQVIGLLGLSHRRHRPRLLPFMLPHNMRLLKGTTQSIIHRHLAHLCPLMMGSPVLTARPLMQTVNPLWCLTIFTQAAILLSPIILPYTHRLRRLVLLCNHHLPRDRLSSHKRLTLQMPRGSRTIRPCQLWSKMERQPLRLWTRNVPRRLKLENLKQRRSRWPHALRRIKRKGFNFPRTVSHRLMLKVMPKALSLRCSRFVCFSSCRVWVNSIILQSHTHDHCDQFAFVRDNISFVGVFYLLPSPIWFVFLKKLHSGILILSRLYLLMGVRRPFDL